MTFDIGLEAFWVGFVATVWQWVWGTVTGLINLGTDLGINLPIIQIPQITLPF